VCLYCWSIFDFDEKRNLLKKLFADSKKRNFWDDNRSAQEVMREIANIQDELQTWEKITKSIDDLLDLAKTGDDSFSSELAQEIKNIQKEIDRFEIKILLSGPYDSGNALLSINAGAGGTDAQDWAFMLMRMYLRWAEQNAYTTEIISKSEGEEAGIKSITILVRGGYAYGYLRTEKGVHRLVRLSPFDAAHRRHTSFVQVEVLPEVASGDPTIKINPDDLTIDIYKSSGAGGQNVQKNATAVRITHIPTGIVVSCQNERSQLQNKENALKVLRGRLYDLKVAEQEKQITKLKGEYKKAEWGNQIRSYILHPYQMVKDHRTDYETGNANSVLDGNINPFIEEYLHFKK
jgi:peptide chain release factor 2